MKKYIYTALLVGIAGYFLFYIKASDLKIVSPLKNSLQKEEIERIALQKIKLTNISTDDYIQSLELTSRRDYQRYLDKIKDDTRDAYMIIPSFVWKVNWNKSSVHTETDGSSGIVVTTDGDVSDILYLSLDYRGKVIQLHFSENKKGPPEESTELERDLLIKRLITEFAGIDTITTPLKTVERSVALQKTEVKYERIINGDIKETLFFRVRGKTLDNFRRTYPLKTDSSGTNITANTVSEIFSGIFTFVIFIMVLVLFIKKAKNDELEYKRGFGLGIFVFIVFVVLIINSESDLMGIIFGGGIGGSFIGASILILYSVAESVNRDLWKEKLTCVDTLFQGNFFVDKIGRESVLGFAFGGIAAFYYYLLLIISENSSYLSTFIDDRLLDPLSAKFPVVVLVNDNLFVLMFLTVGIFLFFLSTIQYKTKKIIPFLLFSILTLPLFPTLIGHIYDRTFLIFVLLLPLTLFFALIYFKNEFLTIFITLTTFVILTSNTLLLNSPDSSVHVYGYAVICFFAILLGLSVFVFEKGKSIEQLDEYKPDYLIRLAEKERFMKELEIARNIQLKFLPATQPKIKGISVASMCIPAMEVGGDYYDFIEIDENRLGVIIGDVSGKGVSAAFYMTMTKGIVKTAAKTGLSPRAMLIILNSIFYENVPRGVFISVIYGIFDFKNRTLTFARAGHNPLILRKRSEGTIDILQPKGLAVGLEKGEKFDVLLEEQTIGIAKGDIFNFYTDGITESMNKNQEEWGEEKLLETVEEYSHLSAEEVLNVVKTRLGKFTGKTEQFDDQTMVIVKIEE
ncbi:PP2C family protein-serine/threonine phosphatase [candidate division KSB1 bacterium]